MPPEEHDPYTIALGAVVLTILIYFATLAHLAGIHLSGVIT